MIKYRASYSWSDDIQPVEIEKETDSSVWIKGRRNAKESGYYHYCDSFQDAKNFLISQAEMRIRQAQSQLDKEKARLNKINALTN